LEAKNREEKQFQWETEKAEGNLSGKIKDYGTTAANSSWQFGFRFFAMSLQKNRLNMPRQMLKEAEKKLKITIEKAEKSDTKDIQKWQDKRVELKTKTWTIKPKSLRPIKMTFVFWGYCVTNV
jgi:hypothetical protein